MTKEARRLKNFLRKHRCLNKFRRNLARIPESAGVGYISSEPFPNIPGAFIWELTPEGHEYWEKLNNLYLKSKRQEEMNT